MNKMNTQLEGTYQDLSPDYTVSDNQTFQQNCSDYSPVYQDILLDSVEQNCLPDSTMFYDSLNHDYSPDSTISHQQGDSVGDQGGDYQYTEQMVTGWQSMVTAEVTGPEEVKVMERKRRNRVAANKCRNKKKEKTNQLILQAKLEEKRNIKLRLIVEKLKEEKNILMKMLLEDEWRDFHQQRLATNNFDTKFVPDLSILEDTDSNNIFGTQFNSADFIDIVDIDSFSFIS